LKFCCFFWTDWAANEDDQQQLTYDTPVIEHENALAALSMRLQDELRAAKSRHLACTEVLLPADLLHRVSLDMVRLSEKEPCGIRGCSIFIEFEDEPGNTR
jgi:RTP801 C-terminal region